MIGQPPINRQPGGLLGFLGIKNGGRNPDQLSNVLAPTWDSAEVYLRTNYILSRINVAVNAVGFVQAGTVPPGESWYVHNAFGNSQAALGAGVVLGGTVAAALIDGVAFSVAGLVAPVRATAGQVWASCEQTRPYQLLPPGTALGFYCTEIAGGPVTVQAQLWYSRFDM